MVATSGVRKLELVRRIWDNFAAMRLGPEPEIIDEDVVLSYMMYRIAFPRSKTDPYAGCIRLSTFQRTERQMLFRVLSERYGPRFQVTLEGFRESVQYKNACIILRRDYGEKSDTVHARPIWRSDEERLIAATSTDTAGKQWRALIRAMVRSGARTADMSNALLQVDVHEREYNMGVPAILLTVPNTKTPRGDQTECWLVGEAYADMKAWLDRRRQMFPSNPYIFITMTGAKISAEQVSRMLNTLCLYAGYGARFFSAHSGRMGFGCRMTARMLADGKSMEDIYDRAAASGNWAPRSSSTALYCDSRVRRFFEGEYKLTYEQFEQLDPCVLHDLKKIRPLLRSSPSWYYHSPSKLMLVAHWLGIEKVRLHTSQYLSRRWISRELYRRSTAFRLWLRQNHPKREAANVDQACSVINSLFEHEWIQPGFDWHDLDGWQLAVLKDEFNYSGFPTDRATHNTRVARNLTRHQAASLEHAEHVQQCLRRLQTDRRIHIVTLPSGEVRRLGDHRYTESDVHEVRTLRPLDELLSDRASDTSPLSYSDDEFIPVEGDFNPWEFEDSDVDANAPTGRESAADDFRAIDLEQDRSTRAVSGPDFVSEEVDLSTPRRQRGRAAVTPSTTATSAAAYSGKKRQRK